MGRQDGGITLIELIIVIAIIGIVLAGIFTFLLWGHSTFNRGVDKTELHQELNLASELITGEIRYAESLNLLPSAPEEMEAGYNYIYYDQESRALVLIDGGNFRQFGAPLISTAEFWQEGNILHYLLEATKRDKVYGLESSVLLLNITASPSGGEKQHTMKYKKP